MAAAEGGPCPSRISAPDDDMVPPEIVSTVFYSATVSDSLAILVAETVGGGPRLTWGNEGAVQLLGYGLDDLRGCPSSSCSRPSAAASSSCCCAASAPPA